MLRLALLLTVLCATAAYAMRPLPDDVPMSTNIEIRSSYVPWTEETLHGYTRHPATTLPGMPLKNPANFTTLAAWESINVAPWRKQPLNTQ